MAKHNHVIINGQVAQNPTIIRDENGVPERGIVAIKTIRGIRDFGNNIDNLRYDMPIVMTGAPELVKKMSKWREGDMVEVKGSLTTRDITRNSTCIHCGHKQGRKGSAVFVNPIYLGLREQLSKLIRSTSPGSIEYTEQKRECEAKGIELLKERCEISNQATFIGPVCREPSVYKTEKGLVITTYQMAIRRKFRIKDDSADTKTDFPWVKAYGAIAVNDAKALKKGTYVFVDGMIQTREFERTIKCEHCGHDYTYKGNTAEIVPYAIEYLRDYNTPEDIEKKEKEEGRLAAEAVLNENVVDELKPVDDPEFSEEMFNRGPVFEKPADESLSSLADSILS